MMEFIIWIVYIIYIVMVIISRFVDVAIAMVIMRYASLLLYVNIFFIIVDFIVDLFVKNKEKRKIYIKDNIKRLLWIAAVVIVSMLLLKFFNYRTNFDLLKIQFIDKNEEFVTEKIYVLKNNIFEKYGIDVYCDTDVFNSVNENVYTANFSLTENEVERFMIMFEDELAKYNQKGLNTIPKKVFLANNISDDSGESNTILGLNFNTFGLLTNYILYNVNSYESTVHHEIFHSIASTLELSTVYKFVENNNYCSLTSDYACTNTAEHLAEAWSHSITYGTDNKMTGILKDLYSSYLIGFDEEANSMNNEEIINAIDLMINGENNHLTVSKLDKEEITYIETKIISKYPEFLLANVIDIVSSNEKTVIYLNRNTYNYLLEVLSNFENEIEDNVSIFDGYDGLEKMRQIYLYIETIPDEDIPDIFASQTVFVIKNRYNSTNYKIGKELYLNYLLKNNGFSPTIELLTTKDGESVYINTVNVNDTKYALYPDAYDLLFTQGYGFLLSSDQIQRMSLRTDVDFSVIECNDESLSEYKNAEIILDEYDETLIKQHIINSLKNGVKNKVLVFYYDNHDDVYKTYQYLTGKEGNSANSFSSIYQRNIGAKCPGYRITTRKKYVLIYGFDYN